MFLNNLFGTIAEYFFITFGKHKSKNKASLSISLKRYFQCLHIFFLCIYIEGCIPSYIRGRETMLYCGVIEMIKSKMAPSLVRIRERIIITQVNLLGKSCKTFAHAVRAHGGDPGKE